METEQRRPAGFWIRLCAGLLDLFIAAVPVVLAAEAAASFGLYIPIEAVALASYAAYTRVGIGWKGKTLGKAAMGLKVMRRDGQPAGWLRASGRAVLVMLSQCLLGLPLIAIGARRSKQGWHDRLTGTMVVLQEELRARRRLVASIVLAVAAGWIAVHAAGPVRMYTIHRCWVADAEAATEKQAVVSKDLVEASSVTPEDRTRMQEWLVQHGRNPAEFVLDMAARHQVTLVGEIHGKKQYLEFFQRVIPDLYYKAHVTVIALECCHPDQNGALADLVNGARFDEEKLRQIARGAVWQAWGYRQHWEVLRTIWQVNQSRPESQKPLRVVGIMPRFDGPSFALVKRGPWYEKLRLVRLIDDLPYVLLHDAHYARCVEKEAFDKGERTVVWVGAAHTPPGPSFEAERAGRVVGRSYRMGAMLAGRYGDAVGQIILHSNFEYGDVATLIEESAKLCSDAGVAFAVADSPFACLRDSAAFGYVRQPRRCFRDSACNYILLAPLAALESADWMDGFISRRMLGRNKPYYEMLVGSPISGPEDADQRMDEGIQNL